MNRINMKLLTISISSIFLILTFQNCSKVKMAVTDEGQNSLSSDPLNQGSGNPVEGAPRLPSHDGEECEEDHEHNSDDLGLKGGHFDLDTASRFYEFNKGATDHHEHEYDDKFDVKSVDFFNLLDKDFTSISSRVGGTQEFIITVANAANSPGAILEINGQSISVGDYQKKVDEFLNGNASALAGYNLGSLQSFKLKFASENLAQNILVATATGCVRSNKPSASGEYRNGALVVQILDKASAKLAANRAATADGGLLWEAAIFWHRDSTCR